MTVVVYDVSEHPRLSAKARALAEDSLAEETALAAERLGISEMSFTGTKLASIKRFLVMQLNYQLQFPDEAYYKKATTSAQSKQSVVYRDGVGPVLQEALTGVNAVIGSSGWADCKSIRRNFG